MESQDTPVQIALEGHVAMQKPSRITRDEVLPHHVHGCRSVDVGEVFDDHQFSEETLVYECFSETHRLD